MSADENDPCGDCIVCQTKMISALVSDEMRLFLSACVESALKVAAHEITGGNLNLIPQLIPTLGVLQLLDQERAAFAADRLDELGIFILIEEEEE